jgi:hypothetical protein
MRRAVEADSIGGSIGGMLAMRCNSWQAMRSLKKQARSAAVSDTLRET